MPGCLEKRECSFDQLGANMQRPFKRDPRDWNARKMNHGLRTEGLETSEGRVVINDIESVHANIRNPGYARGQIRRMPRWFVDAVVGTRVDDLDRGTEIDKHADNPVSDEPESPGDENALSCVVCPMYC